jgi:hypothetical protein
LELRNPASTRPALLLRVGDLNFLVTRLTAFSALFTSSTVIWRPITRLRRAPARCDIGDQRSRLIDCHLFRVAIVIQQLAQSQVLRQAAMVPGRKFREVIECGI